MTRPSHPVVVCFGLASLVGAAACVPMGEDCQEVRHCHLPVQPDADDGGAPGTADATSVDASEARPSGDLDATDVSVVADSPSDGPPPDGPSGQDVIEGEADGTTECDLSRSPSVEPCSIDSRYGVFVSPAAPEPGADGTREHPYSTMLQGFSQARATGKRVYVCDTGIGYTSALKVDASLDGLKIYGGFECLQWTYSESRRARLTAVASPVLTITNLAVGVVIENFDILATDTAKLGASSVGVVINESNGVVLRRLKITSGKGKDGENGDNGGGPTNASAWEGVPGNSGAGACGPDPRGGKGVTRTCSGTDPSTGGSGGDGAINAAAGANSGGSGFPAYAAGKSGTGQPVSGAWDCALGGTGQPGASGPDGSSGINGAGLGSLTPGGWMGVAGMDGTAGQPGQGGGGGGGAKAPLACTASDGGTLSPTGASGGSGGAGGCGGSGGRGGAAGGSSIAVVSIGSEVAFDACEFVVSDAGKGGSGGQGQGGGVGGLPGAGGIGAGNPLSNPGCAGGQGGKGGNGGPGGGGLGGHSIGVAYRGKVPSGLELQVVRLGVKGAGGQPGSGGTGKGDDGIAARWQPFDLVDAGK